jgi:hypothetical protein
VDSRKGVSSGSARANLDAAAFMDGVVGSCQDMEPRAPPLTAMMICARNSAPVGVRDQYLLEARNATTQTISMIPFVLEF